MCFHRLICQLTRLTDKRLSVFGGELHRWTTTRLHGVTPRKVVQFIVTAVKEKGKAIPVTGRGGPWGCEIRGSHIL
jgi:hypothetical protein